MADTLTVTLSDGVTNFTIYPLEANGPSNVSIPRQIQVMSEGSPAEDSFQLNGDLTFRFVVGQTFTVQTPGSPAGPNDGTYTVAAAGSTYSAGTNRTTIPVDEQISNPDALPKGSLYYSIPAAENATSLTLPGRAYVNYGLLLIENSVHMLENFANSTAPANPITGQQWYDSSAGVMKIYAGSPAGWNTGLVEIGGSPAPLNNQIAIWTDGTTLEGDSKLTWNGATLDVTGDADFSGNITSLGFVDAGTAQMLQIDVVGAKLGLSNTSALLYGRTGTAGVTVLGGANSTNTGANLFLYGSSAANGYDMVFRRGTNTTAQMDDSVGSWAFYTGVTTSKVLALTLDASQNATFAGTINALAATTAKASLNIAEGVAPSAPNDGDHWLTAAGEYFVRLNGTSVDLAALHTLPDYELQVGTGDGGSPLLPIAYTTNFNFSTPGSPTITASLQVFVNGIKQVEGASKSYTITAPTTVTFNVGSNPATNDDVEFYGFG